MKRRFVVNIHPAGMVIFAAAFLLMESHLVFACISALLLHEGAHLLVMYLCGMSECTIELTPFGGMMDARHFDAYPPWKRAASAAAGVVCSGLAAVLCLYGAPRTAFWYAFFQANLSLAFLNSLPAWPLDGARVLVAVASCAGMDHRVKRLLSGFTIMLGLCLAAIGIYGAWQGCLNPSLLVAGPYLCYAARAEVVSDKVRRIQGMDQKWMVRDVIPVSLWAGRSDRAPEQFAGLLGRANTGRFHVMIGIDPNSGSVQKAWTEKEMLQELMKTGNN